MAKSLLEIQGFTELKQIITKLGDDKSKRKEVTKILSQLANPTVKVAKRLAPVSKKPHVQKRKNQAFGTWINPGTGRKSIGKKSMRRSAVPMVTVSPRKTRRADGWYLRQFVIPGTKHQSSQPFLDQAYAQTKGKITKDSEKRVAKYIQRQIDRLTK